MHSKPTAEAAGVIDVGGDLTVNRMGFGAMRVTGNGIWGEPPDRERAKAAIRRAEGRGEDPSHRWLKRVRGPAAAGAGGGADRLGAKSLQRGGSALRAHGGPVRPGAACVPAVGAHPAGRSDWCDQ